MPVSPAQSQIHPTAMAEKSLPSPSHSPTRILLPVSQSSIKGYPFPSISSSTAFNWILTKLIHHGCRKDFRLLILHVQVPDEDGCDDMDSLYATADDFKNVKNAEKIHGIHLLEWFGKRCNDVELPCKAWTKKGDPKEIICKEASRVHPDILVVGSRGLGAVQRLFVGTVSDYCTKHADCPVLVIKRNAEDSPDDPVDD